MLTGQFCCSGFITNLSLLAFATPNPLGCSPNLLLQVGHGWVFVHCRLVFRTPLHVKPDLVERICFDVH